VADLASFLRAERDAIVTEWAESMRRRPPGAALSYQRLLDYIPTLLSHIADAIAATSDGGDEPPLGREAAEQHAIDRLEEGFDLSEVMMELSALRDAILRLWQTRTRRGFALSQERVLNKAIDSTLVASADRFARARNRILRALDRISSVALLAPSVEALLQELIQAFLEASPAVDGVTMVLVEDDALRVRAAAGVAADALDRRLAAGHSFAGRVAATRGPLGVRAEEARVELAAEGFADPALQAVYGVPLVDGGDLLGVAVMASQSAPEFSQLDRLLFGSMASRATAGIYQHLLRETAERRAVALAESEARFRATFEHAAVGIAHVALDGTWLRVNERFCRILGYDADELRRMTYHQVTHPDDLADDVRLAEEVLAGARPAYMLEKRYLRKDGRAVWVDLTVSLVRSPAGAPLYFIAVAQDISLQRELRDRLSFLSEAGLVLGSSLDYAETLDRVVRLAVPLIADVCGVDVDGKQETLPDYVALADLSPDNLARGHDVRLRFPPRSDDAWGPPRVMRTGEPDLIPQVGDEELARIAHSAAHLDALRALHLRSVLVVPLAVGPRIFGALTLAQSESGRRFEAGDVPFALELARRAAAAIENARLHAETTRSVELRDQILAIVSHDLRNPLGTIDLSASLLLRHPAASSEPQVVSQASLIRRNARRMARMISDLLDLSALRSGRLSLVPQHVPLAPLLLEALEAHEAAARDKQITLDKDLAVAERFVLADRDRLLQVMGNLLGNAIKFCGPGGRVLLKAEPRDGEALVAVKDTGPGINAEDLSHVFEVYWKKPVGEPGTGLGLYITRGLIEAMGGRIWVESQPGAGSTFSFSLPLVAPA
jgi:PAS domain S-box-containing protein